MENTIAEEVDGTVLSNAQLAAEYGWKATFFYKSGLVKERAFITGCNWEKGFISVESIGERHKPPTIVDLRQVSKIDVRWS
jgi:hypothetical protein